MKKYRMLPLMLLLTCVLLCACSVQEPAGEEASVPTGQEQTAPLETGEAAEETADAREEPESAVLSFQSLPKEVSVAALNEDCSLEVIQVEQEIPIPELTAWKLDVQSEDSGKLADLAEKAANALWDSYTQSESGGSIQYQSPVADTENGEYQETISVWNGETLFYQAKWLDEEETPFHNTPAASRETALALARELAAAFGLEAVTQGEPTTGVSSDADYCFVWPNQVDGVVISNKGLTVRVIGETAVTLKLDQPSFVPVSADSPTYFLSLEEAVYAVNYARGLADSDSVFYQAPLLNTVQLEWVSLFAYPSYTPAYAFYFESESGDLKYTIYVDAYTGEVNTGTNEGSYPSPYQLDGVG
jgi:predicted small secreted protein